MGAMLLVAGTFIVVVSVGGLPLLLRDPWFGVPFVAVPATGLAWFARPSVTPELPRWQRIVLCAEAGVVFAVAVTLVVFAVTA